MAKFILGKKLGMNQIFDENGKVIPVTYVEVETNFVTQVKTLEKDGYNALQVGTSKSRKVSKNKVYTQKPKVRPLVTSNKPNAR